jgi:SAM-dependent methyltransferase
MKMFEISSALVAGIIALLATHAVAKEADEGQAVRIAHLPGANSTSVIADVGAGDGKYSREIARLLGPQSLIYATEIEEEKRDKITRESTKSALGNIRVIEAKVTATGLPNECCDGVFIHAVYHHITEPKPFLESLFASLRPGGKIAVIDFRPTIWLWPWKPKGVPKNRGGHGIPPSVVEAEFVEAGFEHVETIEKWNNDWPQRYFALVFEKPPTQSSATRE